MKPKALFNTSKFYDYVSSDLHTIDSKIKALKKYDFDNSTVDELTEKYYNEFVLDVPVLNREGIYMNKPEDCKISVGRRTSFGGSDRIDGTRFSFYVPFTGDWNLFGAFPSRFKKVLPYGDAKQDEVKVVYEVPVGQNTDQLKAEFDRNVDLIEEYLGYLRNDTKPHNDNLKPNIKVTLKKRKSKLDQDEDSANSFGFPIK